MNEFKETGFQPPLPLEGEHPDGKQYIPFHAGFLGGNKVMNDGFTSNTLVLRLTNTLMPDPAYSESSKITFNDSSQPDTSRLILTLDTRLEDDRRAWLPDKEKYDNGLSCTDNQDEWCLATENHVKLIDITVTMQNPFLFRFHRAGNRRHPGTPKKS